MQAGDPHVAGAAGSERVLDACLVMETSAAVVKFVPSVEVLMRYCDAYAASQFTRTLSTGRTEPRSTCHHWLSVNVEDQRVVELPSFAFAGSYAGRVHARRRGRPVQRLVLCGGGGAM